MRGAVTIPSYVLSVCAQEGGGKTQFGLSAPPPISYHTVDPNTRAVVEKHFGCAIRKIPSDILVYHDLKMPTIAFMDQDDVKTDAEEKWEKFIDSLRPIVNGETDIRSVVLDTATEFDQLNILAEFGKTDQIAPDSRRNRMGPVNKRWSGMIRALADAGVNVLLLHRMERKWETRETRGSGGREEKRVPMEGPWDFERKGHKDTGFENSVEVFLRHDPTRSSKLAGQFGMFISRCTLRPSLIGSEYWGREKQADGQRVVRASFPYLSTLVYPNTSLDDWRTE